jgi:hypothetical protein
VLIAIVLIAFNQNWHVEEERPIGGEYHDEPDDARGPDAPATAWLRKASTAARGGADRPRARR